MSDVDPKIVLANHDNYVRVMQPTWRQMRDAYADRFWSPNGLNEKQSRNVTVPMTEVNTLRNWEENRRASLTYDDPRVVVEPDDIVDDPMLEDPDPTPIKALLDRFLTGGGFIATTSTAIQCTSMYAQGAYRLLIDDSLRPLDAAIAEFCPPWECVWDRRARSREHVRFWGHVRYLPVEECVARYQWSPPSPSGIPDILAGADPSQSTTEIAAFDGEAVDPHYGRIMELWYPYTRKHCIYGCTGTSIVLLKEEPILVDLPNGRPAIPLVPIVTAPYPEFPLWGLSDARSIYELVERRNYFGCWTAQAASKDGNRKLMYKKDRIDDEVVGRVLKGGDGELVAIEGEGGLDSVMAWTPSPSIPESLTTMYQWTEEMLNGIAGSAASRGQASKYVSATDAQTVNDYAETKIGMTRQVLDLALVELAKLYLVHLAHIIEGRAGASVKGEQDAANALHAQYGAPLTDAPTVDIDVNAVISASKIAIRSSGKVLVVGHADLIRTWNITIADGANTPAKANRQRADLANAAPQLIQLATLATTQGTPPQLKAVATKLYDTYVERFDFPNDYRWAAIEAVAPEAPAPALVSPISPGAGVPVAPGPAGQQAAEQVVGLPPGQGGPGAPPAPQDIQAMMTASDDAAAASIR